MERNRMHFLGIDNKGVTGVSIQRERVRIKTGITETEKSHDIDVSCFIEVTFQGDLEDAIREIVIHHIGFEILVSFAFQFQGDIGRKRSKDAESRLLFGVDSPQFTIVTILLFEFFALA